VSARHPQSTAGDAPDSAGCWCTTESWACPTGEIVVLRVHGEIDLRTRPTVQAALTAALSRRPHHLVVDVADVTFCCVRGFALLADTGTTAAAHGTGYAICGLSPRLERYATMLWSDK